MWLDKYPLLSNLVYIGIPILFFFLIAAPWIYQIERICYFAFLLWIIKPDDNNIKWLRTKYSSKKTFKTVMVSLASCWTIVFFFLGLGKIIHDRKTYNWSLYVAVEEEIMSWDNRPITIEKYDLSGYGRIEGEDGRAEANDGCQELVVQYGKVTFHNCD